MNEERTGEPVFLFNPPKGDHARELKLRVLFTRSASSYQVPSAADPLLADPLLERSLFFSTVRGGAYTVECRMGSGANPSALMLMAMASALPGQPSPCVLVEFSQDGAIQALIEQMVLPTPQSRNYQVVQAVPLFPHLEDRFQEVIAEKVADHLIDDLFLSSNLLHNMNNQTRHHR